MPTGTFIRDNCAPAATADDGTMVWYERTYRTLADGSRKPSVYEAFIGTTRGEGRPLLSAAHTGHRGPSDITRDGRYVILTTAVGWDRTWEWSGPGKGSGNAIQVHDRQTGTTRTLLKGATASNRGVIWPKLDAAGTRLVWAQMLRSSFETHFPWGDWDLHVADVDLEAGTLSNERRWHDPAGSAAILETYGWLPGTSELVFQTDSLRDEPDRFAITDCQLVTLPDTLPPERPRRLSPRMAPSWSWQTWTDAFHEFAHFAPGDPDTLYTSVGANTRGGIDVFRYDLRLRDADGVLAQPVRVSYFGGDMNRDWGTKPVEGWPAPAYRNVTSLAWDVRDDDGWVAAVCPDLYCTKPVAAWKITL